MQHIMQHKEPTMTILKPFLSFLFICAFFLAFFWALFTSIAQEQEQREQAAINKIKQAKVGSHLTVAGCGLLKTSGVKHAR
jgi:flagellar biogenesis protein FliO